MGPLTLEWYKTIRAEAVHTLGLETRAGLHAGEYKLIGWARRSGDSHWRAGGRKGGREQSVDLEDGQGAGERFGI
jgi:hypothetical protein